MNSWAADIIGPFFQLFLFVMGALATLGSAAPQGYDYREPQRGNALLQQLPQQQLTSGQGLRQSGGHQQLQAQISSGQVGIQRKPQIEATASGPVTGFQSSNTFQQAGSTFQQQQPATTDIFRTQTAQVAPGSVQTSAGAVFIDHTAGGQQGIQQQSGGNFLISVDSDESDFGNDLNTFGVNSNVGVPLPVTNSLNTVSFVGGLSSNIAQPQQATVNAQSSGFFAPKQQQQQQHSTSNINTGIREQQAQQQGSIGVKDTGFNNQGIRGQVHSFSNQGVKGTVINGQISRPQVTGSGNEDNQNGAFSIQDNQNGAFRNQGNQNGVLSNQGRFEQFSGAEGVQPAATLGQGIVNTDAQIQRFEDPESEPAKYNFKWDVNDADSGNFYGHEEEREGQLTRGK